MAESSSRRFISFSCYDLVSGYNLENNPMRRLFIKRERIWDVAFKHSTGSQRTCLTSFHNEIGTDSWACLKGLVRNKIIEAYFMS